jgi:site-specific DNA-methyltransferase (adenine-specific)
VSAKPATKEAEFTIRHGDCIRCLKQLDPESVDVVVTSPPYNLGIQYGAYNDKKSHEDYLEWCAQWGCEIARVLKPNGSFFLNLGDSSENPYFAFDVAKDIGQLFHLQNTIHWIKSISIERGTETDSYGHFKPINSGRFLNDCHEYVFHFTPEGKTKLDRMAIGVPYADKTNVARWSHTNGKDKRCRGNTWFIPYKTIHQRAKQRPHPATFPTELAVKCIRLHGRQGAVVVDPFLGIGHSAFAAKECGDLVSRFIGFDIDEEYIKVACEVLGCDYSQVGQQTS